LHQLTAENTCVLVYTWGTTKYDILVILCNKQAKVRSNMLGVLCRSL